MSRAIKIPAFIVVLLLLMGPFFSIMAIGGNNMQGYSIKVKISNCKDTLLYLNHYFERDIINDDTARRNPDGSFIFKGKHELDQGLYYISSGSKKRYFDF